MIGMKSLGASIVRQKIACFLASTSNHFSNKRIARTFQHVKLHLETTAFHCATFRNPSPRWQSCVNARSLPPFFLGALAKRNFERDLLCQKQLNSSLYLLCPLQLPAAYHNLLNRHRVLQAARYLVQRRQQLQVVIKPKSSQVASLVRLLVQLSPNKPTHSLHGPLAVQTFHTASVALSHPGRAAFCVSR